MNNKSIWYSATICICSEKISAKKITEILKQDGSKIFEKGEPVSLRNPNGALRNESLWTLESGLDDGLPLEQHINALLNFIENKNYEFNVLKELCSVELFCGFSSNSDQGNLVLSSEMLQRLTIIPLKLVLDLYA